PAHPVGMSDREVDCYPAAHRVTHDINRFQAEGVDEAHHCVQCGDHRVAAEIVTDTKAGKFQNQTVEELGERAQHTPKVTPSRHPRAGSVQQQQRRTVGRTGFVIAQNAGVSSDFAKRTFVGEIRCHACVPPSMRISVPVMNAPSSETSIAITPATADGAAIPAPLDSSVVGMIGINLVNKPQYSSCGMYPPVASVIPDLMLPGATQTARSPLLAYSSASAWVNDWTPPLLAAYAAMYGCANEAEVELKLTIALRGFCSRLGRASRTTRKVPVRFTPMIWFHRSSPICSVCTARRIPAAFTTESRPPKVSTADRTPSTTERSSPMFISSVVRRSPPPTSSALARVLSSPSAATSAPTTAAPSSSSRSAVACPIPDAAPVTRIRLPASRFICCSCLVLLAQNVFQSRPRGPPSVDGDLRTVHVGGVVRQEIADSTGDLLRHGDTPHRKIGVVTLTDLDADIGGHRGGGHSRVHRVDPDSFRAQFDG